MTSKEYIEDIIKKRGQWNEEVLYSDRGCEKHHIIPCCLGGLGDYWSDKDNKWHFKKNSHHENCIYLYPIEHFTVHKLLYLENESNPKLALAYIIMAFPKGKTRRDYELTAEEYELARIAAKQAVSGVNNPMYGKPSWNSGLTKENNKIIADIAEKLSKTKKGVKLGPNSAEARQHKKDANLKRVKEHPETFVGHNRNKLCITNGETNYYINKDEPLPDGYIYGQHKNGYNLDNYYSNKDMQLNRSRITSGENNGMYNKGYLISGGNNGKAIRRFFYKDKTFECMKDLLEYLDTINLHITKSAMMKFVDQGVTKRLNKMYDDILKEITWVYKNED